MSRSSNTPEEGLLSTVGELAQVIGARILHVLRTPGGVVFLSLIMPGLGHVAIGKYKRGLIFAIPALSLIGVLLLILVFNHAAFYQFVAPKTLTSLLAVDVVSLSYHLWAMADAYTLAAPKRPRGSRLPVKYGTRALMAVLVASTISVHAGVAWVDLQVQDSLNCILNPNGPCNIGDVPSGYIPSFDLSVDTPDPGESVDPNVSDSLVPNPTDTPLVSGPVSSAGDTTNYPVPPACTGGADQWAQRNCTLYMLLIGGDAGIGRGGNASGQPINLRTDTMIMLQVDLSTGRSAMYGLPRNLLNVPLGKTDYNAYKYHFFPALRQFGADKRLGCGTATSNCMFNAMWVDAAFVNPSKYPYSGNYFARATKAVEDSVSSLMGVHVSGTVVVDLLGFVDLVNALMPKGVVVTSPYEVKQIKGTPYTDTNNRHLYGLDFPKGKQTLKGEMLLAYARLRHVTGHDSDYYRMSRQQLVLTSMLNQVSVCEAATNITGILNAVKGTIWTDLDWNDAPGLAAIASKIKPGNVRSYTLSPAAGYSYNIIDFNNDGSQDNATWNKYMSRVKTGLNGTLSAYGHGTDTSGGGGGGGGGGGFHC